MNENDPIEPKRGGADGDPHQPEEHSAAEGVANSDRNPEDDVLLPPPDLLPEDVEPGFLDEIFVSQDFEGGETEDEIVLKIRKPRKNEFFAPFDPKSYGSGSVYLLKDEEDFGKLYPLAPRLVHLLEDNVSTYLLVPCISLLGALFLWPIKMRDSRGSLDSWNDSAFRIFHKYVGQVITLKARPADQGYVASKPKSPKAPPVPPKDFANLISDLVRSEAIRSMDHALIKRLLGAD